MTTAMETDQDHDDDDDSDVAVAVDDGVAFVSINC